MELSKSSNFRLIIIPKEWEVGIRFFFTMNMHIYHEFFILEHESFQKPKMGIRNDRTINALSTPGWPSKIYSGLWMIMVEKSICLYLYNGVYKRTWNWVAAPCCTQRNKLEYVEKKVDGFKSHQSCYELCIMILAGCRRKIMWPNIWKTWVSRGSLSKIFHGYLSYFPVSVYATVEIPAFKKIIFLGVSTFIWVNEIIVH